MTTQVVTVGQPQEGTKGAELQMMAPPAGMGTTIVVPQGLPPGLAYLGALNEVLIHQHFDLLEGILLFFEIQSERQIRKGIEDNSKIIFLIPQQKHNFSLRQF